MGPEWSLRCYVEYLLGASAIRQWLCHLELPRKAPGQYAPLPNLPPPFTHLCFSLIPPLLISADATKDKFFQFLWRPRPPTLLSKEKQRDIEKNLRQYAVKYRKQDLARRKVAWDAFVAKRRQERDAWHNSRQQRAAERDAEKAARAKLRGGVTSDDEEIWDEVEEEVEELLEEEVEVIDY